MSSSKSIMDIRKILLSLSKVKRRSLTLVVIALVVLITAAFYSAIEFTKVSAYVVLQTFVGAILLGGFYSLVATGLTINFGITRILNVAHGELMILGAYVTYFSTLYLRVEPLLTIPFAALTVGLVGIPIQKFLISKPQKKPGGREGMFLAFLILVSLSLIFRNAMTLAWLADDRAVHSALTGTSLNIYGIRIPSIRLMTLIISFSYILGIDLLMKKTSVGMKIRATVQDKTAAQLMGVDVDRMYLYAFIIASASAGLAGSLLSMSTSFNPFTGLSYVMFAFIIMMLAGLESIKGTIVASLIVGLLELYVALFLGEVFRYTVLFMILVITLLIKPTGLFGKLEH